MNIGIDITSVIYQRGVSRYTSNLVASLAKRKDINLSLYGSSFRQYNELEKFAQRITHNAHLQHYPPKLQQLLWQLGLNKIKSIMPEVDVFHSWDWIQPPDKDLPLVSTIHDLAILKFPETAHPGILKAHQKSWDILKAREAHIIAISQATRKDVIELLGFKPSHVHTIYEALPTEVVTTTENLSEEKYESIKKRLKLENKPYIFFVGTREPRKNLMRLIEAWQPLSKDYDLLIAGESGWDETSKNEHRTPHTAQPRYLGRVTDPELAVLYGEASLFCYPSLYEGFGLPILEAFYHGTPVVTSNVSSMPEVAGNAAELVDPMDIKSITKGMRTVLEESKDQQKKRLQQMILRLQLFNWDKVAEQTVEVYKKAFD